MVKGISIYDDNDALRKGIEDLLLLSDEFYVCGSYNNCIHIEEQLKNDRPELVLMDIDMPGMSGIEAVRKIRLFNKTVPVIMLTVFEDNTHILDAIFAGASAYILKKKLSEKLLPAIKDVLNEGASLSPAVAKMIINSMQQTSSSSYGFSPREKEILSLLCKGNSYKMIASETKLSFETIRTYIKKIYEKLQVHSATEAVSKPINERLL
jgi:DNA-binding NarL/FixJ family response regulator